MILKPPRGAILNRAHPLSRNLRYCFVLNENNGILAFNACFDQHGILTNAPVWGGGGVVLDATNDYISLGTIAPLVNDAPFSLTWVERVTGDTNTYPSRFYLRVLGGTTFLVLRSKEGTAYRGIGFGNTPTSSKVYFPDDSCYPSADMAADTIYTITSSAAGSTGAICTLTRNGVDIPISQTQDFGAVTNSDSRIGYDGADNGADTIMKCVFLHSKILSAGAIQWLHANPYAMFESESPAKRFFDLGAPPANVIGSRFIYSDIFPVTQLFRGNNL